MSIDPSAVTEAGTGSEVAATLGPGSSIGKYRLDRLLGSGGMGVVWAAFDPDLERPVAIKLLRAADGSVAMRTRLLREARAMARLKHPNVLTVYEVGTDRNRDYIAMELIDGTDLDRWLAQRPPRAEIVAALRAAGRGLAAAHDAGLIHRDLKPHNILRGRGLDGGAARVPARGAEPDPRGQPGARHRRRGAVARRRDPAQRGGRRLQARLTRPADKALEPRVLSTTVPSGLSL